jgi:hypothetical protein
LLDFGTERVAGEIGVDAVKTLAGQGRFDDDINVVAVALV